MRITLVIHAVGGGGAERVMSILANYWATHGWDVTLLILAEAERPIVYALDPAIAVRNLGVIGDRPRPIDVLLTGWQRIKTVRHGMIDSRPDVVISFMRSANNIALLASWGLNLPTIACEHTYPPRETCHPLWTMLMRITYKWADRVTVLTQNALPFYPSSQGYRAIVMPNPLLAPQPDRSIELLPPKTIIAVGRLEPIKGFDRAIRALAKIQDRHPDWQLVILGEGSQRGELEALRDELGLQDRVKMPGRVDNVDDYLAQAELYILSSLIEGFPMGLCEAMAVGLPVLSVDCLSGPADIIRPEIDGILVPQDDLDALSGALDRLLGDPALRAQLAQAAPQVLDRFGLERVMQIWSEVIKSIVRPR